MILKLKSFIYRQTGIYLAHKEENEYIDSVEYWLEFVKISKIETTSFRNIHSLLIGNWQAKNRFGRPMSSSRLKRFLK